ncbi:MAG: DUF1641 domain-containing protein [Calditrichaeota bacterium]|nr:MAG: DUF1641 domain-containing protein [Calditrichota bacterium]
METKYMVNEKDISSQLQDIQNKLDIVVAQVEEQRRKQREMEELKHDLILIGKDAFQAAVNELEEVAPYFETADLVYLLKKLLRNTRNLTRMLEQLESISDFWEDVKPISKEAFKGLLETLDEMDRKGYFEFFTEALKIVDTIVTSFTVEDVKQLRENVTSILLTVKNLTQPDMLVTLNNAVGFYKKMDIDVKENVTFREIFKQLKDPEVKRGLVFLLEFVKSMANPTNGKAQLLTPTNPTQKKEE